MTPKKREAHLSNFWYTSVINATRIGKLFYNLRFEGVENFPKEGPAIILAKHQQYMDSLIIAMAIKDSVGRNATYFIKHSLPDFCETTLGGIKFLNVQDFKELIRQRGKAEAKRIAHEFNAKSYSRIQKTLENGEILMMYPEGGIRRRKMGEIRQPPMKLFQQMQKKIPGKIPMVPLGIEYENWYKDIFCCPPSKITLRVGKPRFFEREPLEKFCGDIYGDIKDLSGL